MPLRTIIAVPQPPLREARPPGFFCRHDGRRVIEMGKLTTTVSTGSQLIAADTAEEVDAEVARLKLTPLPKSIPERAADYFRSLEPALQQQFGALFQAVSAVQSVAEKIRAVEAVTVPDDLAPQKARLLEILRG